MPAWLKQDLDRNQAQALLEDAAPGTFLISKVGRRYTLYHVSRNRTVCVTPVLRRLLAWYAYNPNWHTHPNEATTYWSLQSLVEDELMAHRHMRVLGSRPRSSVRRMEATKRPPPVPEMAVAELAPAAAAAMLREGRPGTFLLHHHEGSYFLTHINRRQEVACHPVRRNDGGLWYIDNPRWYPTLQKPAYKTLRDLAHQELEARRRMKPAPRSLVQSSAA